MKNEQLPFKFTFESTTIDNIKKFLNDNKLFSIHEFSGTLELLRFVDDLSICKQIMTVINSFYDDKILIQSIMLNNKSDLIYIKRKIHENDSYTFMEYDYTNNIEKYEYLDMTENDLYDVIRNKYIHKGVYTDEIGIKNIEYIDSLTDDFIGTLTIKIDDTIKEIKFCDYNTILIKHKEDVTESVNNMNNIINNDKDIKYMSSLFNVGYAIISIYMICVGHEKNEQLSKMLGSTFYGNAIIGIQDKLNKIQRTMDIDTKLFLQIIEKINILSKDPEPKNNDFCNIYFEIMNV
jgi:hypothetical protein